MEYYYSEGSYLVSARSYLGMALLERENSDEALAWTPFRLKARDIVLIQTSSGRGRRSRLWFEAGPLTERGDVVEVEIAGIGILRKCIGKKG